jgi:hypothetical protein
MESGPQVRGKKDNEMMIGFCKVIDNFLLDIQGQANIEKQLISYKNLEEMFSDLAVFLVVQEIAALTWYSFWILSF